MEHWNNFIWYLATYKKADGTYSTALVLSDSKAKDKIFYYRNMNCLVVEL